eukprot:GHRQ01020205.1.p2 GENE.GHRQ01020205.1~~GHRQ01020205.1.p2  ORF type:complete len:178 (+),score=74.19 GHRQ01020205.1:164-697(+)
MIRVVGLSATLPNYADVAAFLRVNAASGLFHFDASYRWSAAAARQQHPAVKYAHLTYACVNQACHSVDSGCAIIMNAAAAAVAAAAAAAATTGRPVPLQMTFVGVTVANMMARNNMMNQICYDKVGPAAGYTACRVASAPCSSLLLPGASEVNACVQHAVAGSLPLPYEKRILPAAC